MSNPYGESEEFASKQPASLRWNSGSGINRRKSKPAPEGEVAPSKKKKKKLRGKKHMSMQWNERMADAFKGMK